MDDCLNKFKSCVKIFYLRAIGKQLHGKLKIPQYQQGNNLMLKFRRLLKGWPPHLQKDIANIRKAGRNLHHSVLVPWIEGVLKGLNSPAYHSLE